MSAASVVVSSNEELYLQDGVTDGWEIEEVAYVTASGKKQQSAKTKGRGEWGCGGCC